MINQEFANGAKLSSNGLTLLLEYPNGAKIDFNCQMITKDGFINGVEVISASKESHIMTSEETKKSDDAEKSLGKDIQDFHEELGHPSPKITKATAKAWNIKLKGRDLEKRTLCAVAKVHQSKTKKETKEQAGKIGERLYIDILSPKTRTFAGNRHWLLIVDDALDMCWLYFLKRKSHLPEKMMSHLTMMKAKYDVRVRKICMDNAGENLVFEKECMKKGISVNFEYTAPGTPQHNG